MRSNGRGRIFDNSPDAYKKSFDAFIRAGIKPSAKGAAALANMKRIERNMRRRKSYKLQPGGSYSVPERIVSAIERQERLFKRLRIDQVEVEPIGASDYKELVSLRGLQLP